MKFAWKIFCVTYIIVMLTVGIGGFVLVEVTTSSVTNSRVDSALTSNRYAGKMFASYLDQSTNIDKRLPEFESNISRVCNIYKTDTLSIHKKSIVAKNISEYQFVEKLENSQQGYSFAVDNQNHKLIIACRIDYGNIPYYIVTTSQVNDIFDQHNRLVAIYRYAVFGIALFAGVILFLFSVHLAKPLKYLSAIAGEITKGNYGSRILLNKTGSEEVNTLAQNFNIMADAVESNIENLNNEMEKRDAFVADFTHELKTPMTSIIGYADMLRTYSLSPQETREIADIVYNEGKRLQKLSMRLLDIIVLKNQKIELKSLRTDDLFANYQKSVIFLINKYKVAVDVSYQKTNILCEKELLMSLLYNLTDNACKASSKGSEIFVTGEIADDKYKITVKDFGRGIDKANLEKITEPFFMEDKSRSRKQGGAGLGLALCKQIAFLHGTSLNIESEKGKGTSVSFLLPIENGGHDEE